MKPIRPLAFIDIETTGLDTARHEILEIGIARVDAATLTVLEEIELRVLPTRIEDADPEALRVNGYSPGAWALGVPLEEALHAIAPLLEGAVHAGHNPAFDRSFLREAWRRTDITPPPMDYHLFDSASLAWPLYAAGIVPSLSLGPLCEHFEIERPIPHRALADALASLELTSRLLPASGLAARLASFEDDERAILDELVHRMAEGRKTYGPWKTNDGRDYAREALLEVLDGMHYTAAALVRLGRVQGRSAMAGGAR